MSHQTSNPELRIQSFSVSIKTVPEEIAKRSNTGQATAPLSLANTTSTTAKLADVVRQANAAAAQHPQTWAEFQQKIQDAYAGVLVK